MHPGKACSPGAAVRFYSVVALNVDITLNRFGDHDPQGRMYVLAADAGRVRDEETRNAGARAGRGQPAASIGLQGDAIQPLTLRVNQGECLRIRLEDRLFGGEPASLHLHGSSLRVAGGGGPAVAANRRALAFPGRAVTYEWMVRKSEREGTHYFHSHGSDRMQSSHGLFGAVIVEPKGSRYLDPGTGGKLASGWSAVIVPGHGAAFREYALYYHEIGDESYQPLDKDDHLVPLVDPLLSDYRPSARAINYRSEAFMNRMKLQHSLTGRFDESVSYSSYAFGDPATPIARAYLGDPAKERVIHAGSEVFHVHHVHGGSIRWHRQPGESQGTITRLEKHPSLLPGTSERIDSQAIGPSETYDAENECGSGGCQQSAGDYLFHCHVAQHYFAGMWGIWRVYNTRQDGASSTDSLPPLMELPGRGGSVSPAVTSDHLAAGVASALEHQLPPPGTPKGYDASVLDWTRQGSTYLGEPEDTRSWPGYSSPTPGARPPLRFDPATGRLAYPFLKPHLGKRPPFAPGHGPAPFLDPVSPDPATGALPLPGANGPASVCPAGTRLRSLSIDAIKVPITLNSKDNVVDPSGEIFVLAGQEAQVRADNTLRRPLAIRANASEDCVDVLLRSQLEDDEVNHGFSKVNAHIHFVQFDVQASDGVITGFNYEQSVRPFRSEGETISAAVPSGAASIPLSSADRFQPGALVGVGMERDATFEIARISEVRGSSLVLAAPLRHDHERGEYVSTEFVRYRWYPDVQFGTAYFHDHVNALASWRHGLFGALIAEPPGSTYHDPSTGAEIDSGSLADIHTSGQASADVRGSFREMVAFIQDDNPITAIGASTGSSLNLRAEPLDARGGDHSLLFSSQAHGDPETPVFASYLGDPLVVRTLVAGTNDVHTWHLDGHWFRAEPFSTASPPLNTIHVGISERYDVSVPRAGGPQKLPGDYLFYSGRSFKLHEGSWGILRVLGPGDASGLKHLPGHDQTPAPAASVCPPGAPRKQFSVSALNAPLPMLDGDLGKIYAVDGQRGPPAPLVLHIALGDCLEVSLTNRTSGPVSFHADRLAYDPLSSGGIAAGRDPPQTAAPGQSRNFTFYASPETGPGAALIRDWGDVTTNPGLGLYGGVVVGPPGATFTDPATGQPLTGSSWAADVHDPHGPSYRDFSLFFEDDDAGIGTHRMPYRAHVQGTVGLNYEKAPLEDIFRPRGEFEARTPLMRAFLADPVKIHVLVPWSEQAQVFSLEGHRWPEEPGRRGTDLLSSVQVGGLDSTTLELEGGAGGIGGLPGDYLYGDHREPYHEAGLWGIFRVRCPGGLQIAPLKNQDAAAAKVCGAGGHSLVPWLAGAALALLAVAGIFRRRQGHLKGPVMAQSSAHLASGPDAISDE